jgi:DNA ligase-associated metallophosphoesterase
MCFDAGALDRTLGGETVSLRADRCLYWPRKRVLFVADLHLGKGSSMRAIGLPVPPGSSAATILRMKSLTELLQPKEVVILGDLWHARGSRSAEVCEAWMQWRTSFASAVTLIIGNHDRRSGRCASDLGIDERQEGEVRGPFTLFHHPPSSGPGPWLAGHIHPGVDVIGRGKQSLRLSCFHLANAGCVLPAFGDFTGTARIRLQPGEEAVALAGDRLLSIRPTCEIHNIYYQK